MSLRDILMEQVQDVLDIEYKFTHLIRSERVVVGAKQESKYCSAYWETLN